MEYKVKIEELREIEKKKNVMAPQKYLDDILKSNPKAIEIPEVNHSSWFADFFYAVVIRSQENGYKVKSSKKLYDKAVMKFASAVKGTPDSYFIKHK